MVYLTRLNGHELARFRIPSRAQAAAQTSFGDYGDTAWPTPELPHRAQQFYIEAILREQVARYPSVTTRYGWRVEAVSQSPDLATLNATEVEGEATLQVNARYLVGCDGPRSLVRKAIGAQYEGASHEQREFFGGQMLGVQFRSRDFYQRLQHGPLKHRAWMMWVVNPVQRAILVAINGVDQFAFGVQLKPGKTRPVWMSARSCGRWPVLSPAARCRLSLMSTAKTSGRRATRWWPTTTAKTVFSSQATPRICSRPPVAWVTTQRWTTL